MADTAADVPGRYDVLINGHGYVFADTVDPSLPFRTHRAIYDLTQPFVERQNVSNQYGDNTQDFFLTATQNDWSEGEQQRFFRAGDKDSVQRYWTGTDVDVTVPGQVSLQKAVLSPSFGGTISAVTAQGGVSSKLFATSSTNLYEVAANGGVTDRGAHGAGATPCQFGICSDGSSTVFISGQSGNKIRKWDGASFTTFSSLAGTQAIMYNNNTLYAMTGAGGSATNLGDTLNIIDSTGAGTAVFTWKHSDGSVLSTITNLRPFGGEMLVSRYTGAETSGGELWTTVSATTGVKKIAKFASNFFAYGLEVVNGVAFVSGSFVLANSTLYQQAVYYYANGTIGLLWKANKPSTNLTHPTITSFQGGLVIADESVGNLLFYSPDIGGVSTIGTFSTASIAQLQQMAGGLSALLMSRGTNTGLFFPSTTTAANGTVLSSLFDFDSSLTKLFRGVKVDFSSATDGDGGSVDLEYQIDSVDGSYTVLASGITSGTEVLFPTNTTGHSISIGVGLNKGTSTAGPVLKRVSLRAAPILPQYRSGTFIIDCANSTQFPRQLRDGTYHPLQGYVQVQNLLAAAEATAPFTVVDRLGTYTALMDLNDPDGFDVYEVRPNTENPKDSGSYLVRLKVRQV